MKKKLVSMALLTAAAFGATEASALTHCSIVSGGGIHFGRYDIFSMAPLDAAGSFSYECHGDTADDLILIELGRGNGSSFLLREMTNGASRLAYNLYLDATYTAIWGDGTGGSHRLGPMKPQKGTNTIWIYGRIPARQSARVGGYTDTLTVTIVY